MDQNFAKILEEQNQKIDKIYASVEKTRKYFLWSVLITAAAIFVPMIGLYFAAPAFLNYIGNIQGIGL